MLTSGVTTVGNTAQFSCDEGHDCWGCDVLRQCMLDGSWSGLDATCDGL